MPRCAGRPSHLGALDHEMSGEVALVFGMLMEMVRRQDGRE